MPNDAKTEEGGLTVERLFSGPQGLTFDDIIILPPFSSCPEGLTVATSVARGLEIKLPVISSPMDTVTEWRTAVEMALQGGLGIIHFNLTPEEAAEQVRRVKRFQMGFITEPLCRPPACPLREVREVKREYGFSTILVTEDGTPHSRFLGMVSRAHAAFEEDEVRPIRDVMTPAGKLRVCSRSEVPSLKEARDILHHDPLLQKLPILNPDGSVFALVTRDDVVKSGRYPHALTDANEQLRVGASVSTQKDDWSRVEALIAAGVDLLVIDTAQGGTSYAVSRLKEIKRQRPDLPVIAGNVVTVDQARPLVEAGADGLRVGMGSGSICTTQGVLGIGRPQLSAVHEVASWSPVPVISDGGTRGTADIVKALACGASAVMVGRYIAGCDETPGDVMLSGSQRLKRYRGMGSAGAIRDGGSRRYGHEADRQRKPAVVQGVEGWVPAAGPLEGILTETAAAIAKALEYLGCASVAELHQQVRLGRIRFQLRSDAARQEGAVHDISVSQMAGPPRKE